MNKHGKEYLNKQIFITAAIEKKNNCSRQEV